MTSHEQRRNVNIINLLRMNMGTIPSITDAQIEDACALWNSLGERRTSLRHAEKNIAAGLEYFWHMRQTHPLRTQKEVSLAHNVSASIISQLRYRLDRLFAENPSTSPKAATSTTQENHLVAHDPASPKHLPHSLPSLHHHMTELFELGLWDDQRALNTCFFIIEVEELDLLVLCFIPRDTNPPSIKFFPIKDENDAMEYRERILSAHGSSSFDASFTSIDLLPLSLFHKQNITAIINAELMPINQHMYPHVTEQNYTNNNPTQMRYLLSEAFTGALLSLIRLEPHMDTQTYLQVSWRHNQFDYIHVIPIHEPEKPDDQQETVENTGEQTPSPLDSNQVEVYTLEISLQHSKPRIWRRIRIRSDLTFLDLHHAIQDCMDWFDSHLWEFRPPRSFDAFALHPSQHEFDPFHSELTGASADMLPLSAYFGHGQTTCTYLYDFGDDWHHIITLKKTERLPLECAPTRELIAGKQVAPFEDCGGIPGFERLMTIARTGKDPWGASTREIKELKQFYELDFIEDFDLSDTQSYFNEMTEERYSSSFSASPSDMMSSLEDMMYVPSSLQDQVLESFASIHIRQHNDAHPKLIEVFYTLMHYGLAYGWNLFLHKCAITTWSQCLKSGQFKKKKPAVYAGALLYAMSLELLENNEISQENIASALGISTVSISKNYRPILHIIQEKLTHPAKLF